MPDPRILNGLIYEHLADRSLGYGDLVGESARQLGWIIRAAYLLRFTMDRCSLPEPICEEVNGLLKDVPPELLGDDR